MATIVLKASDGSTALLDNGKLVVIGDGARIRRSEVIVLDDTSWSNLTEAYGEPVSGAPVAAFTSAPTTPDHSVEFTDTSTNAPTSWSWTFGDGGSATTETPSHTYAAAGDYTVTLVATNAAGSSAPFAVVVTVA